jgi:FtsZ-binding cell division protein ZapB
MSRDTYLARLGIHQQVKIDQLVEDNTGLTLQLQDADTEIATLKLEVAKLKDDQLALTATLQQEDGEIGRLTMVIKRQKGSMEKSVPGKKSR